jgi:hypothetical protein
MELLLVEKNGLVSVVNASSPSAQLLAGEATTTEA